MYLVLRKKHEQYGNVIEIVKDDVGEYKTPFLVLYKAKSLRSQWINEGAIKVRFLVDNQILPIKHIDRWANDEYRSLPKCEFCGAILMGQVFNHQFSQNNLFCSQICSDKDFDFQMEKYSDEEECDYL
jgi:hypothetical protein